MNSNITVHVQKEEFLSIIDQAVKKALRSKEVDPMRDLPSFLTRKQSANFLNVAMSTFDYLTRNGRIKKYYNDGLVRFKKEEVLTFYQTFEKYQRG
mgnify:CR=1 FL=1